MFCLEASKGLFRSYVVGEVGWGAGGGSVQCGGEGNGKRGGGGKLWSGLEMGLRRRSYLGGRGGRDYDRRP